MKEIINHYGGIAEVERTITHMNDHRVCAAGRYDMEKKFGGVDGFSNTKCLEEVVRNALTRHEVILCEGSFLGSFGMNLTNAAFAADKQLVVFLYAPVSEINRRLQQRSNTGITNDGIWKRQKSAAASARKWASIGVPVMCYDTSKVGMSEIANQVTAVIEQLCGE